MISNAYAAYSSEYHVRLFDLFTTGSLMMVMCFWWKPSGHFWEMRIHCVMAHSISSSTIWIAKRAIGYDWLQSQLYIYINIYIYV